MEGKEFKEVFLYWVLWVDLVNVDEISMMQMNFKDYIDQNVL